MIAARFDGCSVSMEGSLVEPYISTSVDCNETQFGPIKYCIRSWCKSPPCPPPLPECCSSRRRRWRGYRLCESSSRQSTYADIKSNAEAYCGHVPVPFQKTSNTALNLAEATHCPVRSTSHAFAVPRALRSLQSQGARASRRGRRIPGRRRTQNALQKSESSSERHGNWDVAVCLSLREAESPSNLLELARKFYGSSSVQCRTRCLEENVVTTTQA